jgi:Beta-lactamase
MTGALVERAARNGAAHGNQPGRPESRARTTRNDQPPTRPEDGAAGPYTTAVDMLRFAISLQDGTLLPPAYARMILSGKFPPAWTDDLNPSPLNNDPPWQSWMIGYGTEDTVINGHDVLGHAGNGPGIATGLDIYPALGWVAMSWRITTSPHLERPQRTAASPAWKDSSSLPSETVQSQATPNRGNADGMIGVSS